VGDSKGLCSLHSSRTSHCSLIEFTFSREAKCRVLPTSELRVRRVDSSRREESLKVLEMKKSKSPERVCFLKTTE